MVEKQRRVILIAVVGLAIAIASLLGGDLAARQPDTGSVAGTSQAISAASTGTALSALDALPVKGRAPKTDYDRAQFGAGWAAVDECDMRQYILARDMTNVRFDADGCTVLSGTLNDPYTGKRIEFTRGKTSSAVQIDHVVALSNAWQTGAQQLDESVRAQFANDPLNLLAVDGPTNQKKSDADAASWLPPNQAYRCRYVARQIAVKQKYELWVTSSERSALQRQLQSCPEQILPIIGALD